MSNSITLVIFTCEGRALLLQQTIHSFRKNCDFDFDQVILAVDGSLTPGLSDLIQPDIVIQSRNRKGYFNNITQARKHIQTPYFFWLEDDWSFTAPISMAKLLQKLISDDRFSQITLAKESSSMKDKSSFSPDFYKSPYQFSANPSLCRTELVSAALEHLHSAASKKEINFEVAIGEFMEARQHLTVLHTNSGKPYVCHEGYVESSDRNFHLLKVPANKHEKYLSAMANRNAPTIFNKIGMLFKLLLTSAQLSVRLFFSREAYDFTFRIINAYLNR